MKIRMAVLLVAMVACAAFIPAKPAPAQEQPRGGDVIEYLEFREVDIKDVLRQLSKQYNLNIVFSESVRGLVTVQLNKVSVEQALDSIITVNGFAYTKKDNVFKITSQEEAAREGKQTKLFRLRNADAPKLKDTLAKVLSADGSIEADARSNSIVVTDSLTVINKIERMIPSLDEVTSQVLIEAKLIETSLTNTEKLGIDWQTTIRASGSKRPTSLPLFSSGKGGLNEKYYPDADTSSGFTTVHGFPHVGADDFTLGTLDFTGLSVVLDFLKTRSNTKLVASPRIVTLNNQQATINVGRVVPLALYERNETTGAWEVTGWEEMNVGVNLQVTPQISPDGHIKLKLKPEVSNIVDYIGEDVNRRPITSTRTAETEVIINDGMTVVIAGLVKEKDALTSKKIPILGDIPLIGALFTRKETGTDEEPKERTDLLIFVTARILKDNQNAGAAADAAGTSAYARPFKTEIREKNAQ